MRPHYKLEAWKNAMKLVEIVYNETEHFPREEIYGLSSQIRRSAVSVPSNIAEGAARKSNGEFAYFINISLGSLSELETQLIIAKRRRYLTESKYIFQLLNKISSQLMGLYRKVSSQK